MCSLVELSPQTITNLACPAPDKFKHASEIAYLLADRQRSMSLRSSTRFRTISVVVAALASIFLIPSVVRGHGPVSQESSLSQAFELEKRKDFAGAERLYKEALSQ